MKKKNFAFIDGQNLYFGVRENGFTIDFKKFRKYLEDQYGVEEAYYFLGFIKGEENALYTNLQKVGFVLIFREHSELLAGKKKGNVDTDIVFEVMKSLIEEEDLGKILLVSGDGDYYKLVRYLIEKDRFLSILFPAGKYASSLYNKLDNKMKLSLNRIRSKIEYKNEKGAS